MSNRKCLLSILGAVSLIACFLVSALGQTAEDRNRIANISGGGSMVRWDVSAPNAGVTMTISAPDGRVFRREYKAGASLEFMTTDKDGERLPDGQYIYELRLSPSISAGARKMLAKSRGNDDDPEDIRAARKRATAPGLVESGSFSIINGSVVVAGASEETDRPAVKAPTGKIVGPNSPKIVPAATATKQHHPLRVMSPDQVIPDDLIVQGSACVGLDCVNNENFGFDTIRLKENNTRLQFDDTSTSAGFPTNNWQIRANDSGGGTSFLGFVDQGSTGNSETGTIVFRTDAGAPANSLRVSSTGRIGIRTATPVLDVHANTSDTPAIRLEQNNTGGFAAQTWDIAGNEANFFVRDVTSGSLLPFRIRPGAPTSSIDISASGNVGIGTASPTNKLDVVSAGATTVAAIKADADRIAQLVFTHGGTDKWFLSSRGTFDAPNNRFSFFFNTGAGFAERMSIDSSGNVGIGTNVPTALLSVNGTANKPGGGSWDIFSDERLKNIKGRFNSGLKAVMQLQPIRYEYTQDNALGIKSAGEHVGFGAQAVQKVIPEAVTRNENGYLQINNDPILWTMLNAIQEQQKEIEQLKGEIRKLRRATRSRR